ncbi:hypothetical protein D9M71_763930 [compost metagenome]
MRLIAPLHLHIVGIQALLPVDPQWQTTALLTLDVKQQKLGKFEHLLLPFGGMLLSFLLHLAYPFYWLQLFVGAPLNEDYIVLALH